ncbi:FtsK/SpoIIIE family DNA translocase [Aureimonas fodinaquatilis]|nr:DNA translocase FtsK [Aureimonas fodinaquatilis]
MLAGGVALLGLAVYLAAALATWNVADPSFSQSNSNDVTNMAGASGAIVADLLMQIFGLASVLAVVLPFVWGGMLLSGRRLSALGRRGWFAIGGMVLAATALGCFGTPAMWPLPIGLGGVAGDVVLKFPALVTGAYPSGLAGGILGVVLMVPAGWMFLQGTGLVGRETTGERGAGRKGVEPAAMRSAQSRQTMVDEDEERVGRWQLVAGAVGHLLYSVRSNLRRPQPRAANNVVRREPVTQGNWQEPVPMAPRAAPQREIRVVDPRPFDGGSPDFPPFDMPEYDEFGYEPAPASARAAAPAAHYAPQVEPADRAQAYAEPAVEMPVMEPPRRMVDTSRATVRQGRSDWNGSYASTRLGKRRGEVDEPELSQALEEAFELDERENDDAHEAMFGQLEADDLPEAHSDYDPEDEAPFFVDTPAPQMAREEERVSPVAPGREKTGGWRDLIPANVVAFPGLGRGRQSLPEPANQPNRSEPVFPPVTMPAMEAPVRVVPAAQQQAPVRATRPERVYQGQPSHAYQPEFFELPSIGLLTPPKARTRDETLSPEMLQENARLLEGVLDDFGVKGEIIEVRPGPVVTLYELEPAPGIKSSRVIGLADDIARSMSAIAARVAVIPGKNAIGIELPNARRETVYLREMLAADSFQQNKGKLPLTLGKTIGGEPVIADLAKMPHLLVAGTTGSGKSVSINTMILSLLYRLSPAECRMIMIDPKMLELSIYDGIPHLLSPVVTDPKKAVVALKWTVREMEDRYRKMSKVGVRNIDGFNTRVAQAIEKGESISRTVQTGFDRETGEPIFESEEFDLQPLPYIVVIIDEMADLMMVAGKEIEGTVQRLAQMARAAGIHVIMATQRPSVDVITGTIKANFPTRISFQVTSKIDSRTILQEQGAEQLLGMGDMLYMAGGGRIQRVHGPFVGDAEVEAIVSHLKSQGVPDYLDSILEEDDEESAGPASAGGGGLDESADLYDQAVAIVLRDGKASTSYVQRRLQIGYNRAASIIERMEQEGIVGAANHAGKREILVPTDNA